MRIGRSRRPATANAGWAITIVSLLLLAGIGVLLWAPWNNPDVEGELRIYCAAGMTKPMTEVMDQYKGEHKKIRFITTFAGSGELISNMRTAGGEGDLYVSADDEHVQESRKHGLIEEVIPISLIHPKLVVNAELQASLKKQGREIKQLKDLLRKDVTLVIADEMRTAMGRLTKQVLEDHNLWQKVLERRNKPKEHGEIVTGATVNDTAVKIRTSRKAVGVIWDVTAKQNKGKIDVVEVDELKGLSEQVSICVLKKSKDPAQALRFARFLTAKDKGAPIWQKHFHETPTEADPWVGPHPEINLYAGAMLKPGIDKTVHRFAERNGVTINTNYNGCGILVGQMKTIKKGSASGGKAFPDAYFSCDQTFLDQVNHWFEAGVLVTKNDMVLIVHKSRAGEIQSIKDIDNSGLKIGVADPQKSALGELTRLLLKTTPYYDEAFKADGSPKHLSVSAGHELVNQVRTGALDVGIVYRSNAKANQKNLEHYKIVEMGLEKAFATQPFAVAKDSKHKQLMRRLLEEILRDQTKKHMESIGFEILHGKDK